DPHSVRIARVDEYGVQAQTSVAVRPFFPGWVAGQAGHLFPGGAAVVAGEQPRFVYGRVHGLGLRRVSGNNLPDAIELEPTLLVVVRARLDLSPSFSQVIAEPDSRAENEVRGAREHPAVRL